MVHRAAAIFNSALKTMGALRPKFACNPTAVYKEVCSPLELIHAVRLRSVTRKIQ